MQELLPYILIIVGIIFIIVSFFLPDKEKEEEKELRENLTPTDRANLIAQGKKEIDGIFNDRAEDTIEKVEEQLSRLSNEKIISVSEYSDQVLEKINQNHQEVVFLYNMLNEKEEEMKKMMAKMKPITKEDTLGEKQAARLAKQAAAFTETQIERKEEKGLKKLKELKTVETMSAATENVQEDAKDADIEMLRELIYDNPQEEKEKKPISAFDRKMRKNSGVTTNTGENSISKQVIEMYQDGMSILEISKALHRGQGEVQLIIELYAKK